MNDITIIASLLCFVASVITSIAELVIAYKHKKHENASSKDGGALFTRRFLSLRGRHLSKNNSSYFTKRVIEAAPNEQLVEELYRRNMISKNDYIQPDEKEVPFVLLGIDDTTRVYGTKRKKELKKIPDNRA